MPVYEYACEQCGQEFEVEQRITEEPLTTHDACGGPVKRLISMTSFALRGNGWYSDHYGLKSGDGAKKESTDAKDTPAKPEAKPEKKTATSGGGGDTGPKPACSGGTCGVG